MRKFVAALAGFVLCATFCAACAPNKQPDKDNGNTNTTPPPPQQVGYDTGGMSDLFYQNAVAQFGSAPVVGDPFLYYEEEEQTFYLYGTTGGKRFDYYTSKDLKEWELSGTCFQPTSEDWCRQDRLWAPEMHKIGDKYYLYYSAGDKNGTLRCSVAVGDSPAGPFTNDIDEGAKRDSARFDFSKLGSQYNFPTIDGTVFEDDDGSLYYYCAKDQVGGVSTIWGIQLENPYTFKEGETPVQLTRVGYSDVEGSERREWEVKQGSWNEGPYMVKHDGVYYLTYSANFYQSKYYGVGYATSTNPLAGFVKPEDSMLLGTMGQSDAKKEWDYVSGTGHHMFIDIGGQSYIVYHKHYNIKEAGNVRIFTIDAYGFRDDGSMYVNGSTISPQPRPQVLSGYGNIVSEATVSCSGIDGETRKLLKDGGIGVYPLNSYKTDVTFDAGKTVITLKFSEARNVRSVMLYAGTDYTKILKKVDKIEFGEVCYVTDVRLDNNYIDTQREYMAVGNAISATLAQDVKVSEIKITINSESSFMLSEIAVLGK